MARTVHKCAHIVKRENDASIGFDTAEDEPTKILFGMMFFKLL